MNCEAGAVAGATMGGRNPLTALSSELKDSAGAASGSRWVKADLPDFASRVAIGVLFVLLSLNLLGHFVRTHQLTGLLLLISEGLVVVLTIVRRPAASVDRSAAAALIAAISMVGPPLLRAGNAAPLLPDRWTALLSAIGLMIVISGKLVLGRSFGIVPANRGVVARGPYLLVRHPIYTGYLLTHVGFILAHPELRNVLLVAGSDIALVVRALYEERELDHDPQYRAYCTRVRWRLVPRVI